MRKFTNDDYTDLLKKLPITSITVIGPKDNFTFIPVKVTDYAFANYNLTHIFGPSVPYEQIEIYNHEKQIYDKYDSQDEKSNKLVRDIYNTVKTEDVMEHNRVVTLYEQNKNAFPIKMPITKRIDAIKEMKQVLNKHIEQYIYN